MSKNKKGKIVQLRPHQQSPENYIKTQVRSLPVAECLISEEWEETALCNITVARAHKNGNFTVGVYLVDLYCLGVKDAWYQFNISPDDYAYLKHKLGDVMECDYTLVHNIIYGAIAFAADYGFKPQKGFDVVQFILEEDDDNVELMELEFGLNGMPFFAHGPYDEPADVKRIKATLERTAGAGNFIFEEASNDDLDFDIDDDDGDEEEFDGEVRLGETIEDIVRMLKLINKVYEKAYRTAEARQMMKQSTIGKGYRLSSDRKKMDQNKFDDAAQENLYRKMHEAFHKRELEKAEKGLEKAIEQYPGKPQFYTLLQGCYYFSEKNDKLNASIMDMYPRFPGYLYAKIPYANLLIDSGRLKEVPDVFEGKTDLNYLYPNRKTFHTHEAGVFLATMCRYFVAKGDIDSADLYMNAIIKKELWAETSEMLISNAMVQLYNAKVTKVRAHLELDVN